MAVLGGRDALSFSHLSTCKHAATVQRRYALRKEEHGAFLDRFIASPGWIVDQCDKWLARRVQPILLASTTCTDGRSSGNGALCAGPDAFWDRIFVSFISF